MASPSLRLAYVISRYPAINHTYLLREIAGLRRNGFQIEVISIRKPDRGRDNMSPAERAEEDSTYYVERAGPARWLADHLATFAGRPRRYLGALLFSLQLGGFSPRETLRWLLWFGEAVVAGRRIQTRGIPHTHAHYASSVALLAARIFRFSISNTIHGPAEFENPETFRLREKIGASRFVVAVSSYSRSQLMRYSPCSEWHKFEVCRLGVELSRYTPASLGQKDEPFTVVSVGTLCPEKGTPVLVDAISRLTASGRNLRARVVGDGPLRTTLKELVRTYRLEDHICLEGALNHESVIPLYGQSHALVLPSFAEGLPVVLMEAMAAGLPCIATRITGIPELIEDGVDGLLVPASDVDALAQAIARLMDNEDLRQRLGEAARRKVERGYDITRNSRALARIFLKRLKGEDSLD